MARLSPFIAALALLWTPPAAADPLDRWSPLIAEAANRFALPEDWIRRVMRAESAGQVTFGGRPVVSRAGAMGLMQLMPGTWREMRALLGLGDDPQQPRDNILAGAAYLRSMYDRFGYPGLFAAYNAGPARYADHLATNRPLPAETVAYVAATAGRRADSSAIRSRAVPGLFAVRGRAPAQALAAAEANGLFVPLSAGGGR